MNDKAYWLWLQKALGVGINVDEIVACFGNAKNIYFASPVERATSGVFTRRQLEKIKETPLDVVDEIIESCRRCKCRVLTPDDGRYPKRLMEIRNFPLVLYYKGNPEILNNRMTIALVGTRKASQAGLNVANRLACSLVRSGCVVVSGGALGIDGAAHLGALSENGETVAVLGCGFLAKYRDSVTNLKDEITEKGLLISEYPPNTPAVGRNFPIRNRIISGLSCGVVVVEGSIGSGSLITAKSALEQKRELFAVPGDAINSLHSGTIELIRNGATPVFSCADVVAPFEYIYPDLIDYSKIETSPLYENKKFVDFSQVKYGVSSVFSQQEIPDDAMREIIRDNLIEEEQNEKKAEKLTGNEKTVYEVLSYEPMHIDDIARRIPSLTAGKIMVSLTRLEMENMIVSDSGKNFRRK